MIPEPETLAVFCLAALALLVVPGPAVLYIVASSIDGTSSLTGRTAAGAPWSMPRISARKYADVRITPKAAITASTVYVGAGSPGDG